jgi:hypothetical protein
MQKTFNQAILNLAKPCAVRGRKFSEVKNCSMFGLRLGMTFADAKQMVEHSGYFPQKVSLTKIKGCHSNNQACVGYIFASKDGLSISIDFDPSSEGDESRLSASQISLWFDPGANPYFDPNSLRATFVKVIGAPDTTDGSDAFWGDPGGRNIRIYVSESDRKCAVILEGTHPRNNQVQPPTKFAANDYASPEPLQPQDRGERRAY